MLTEHDIYLFKEGTHSRLYEEFGCQLGVKDGVAGAHFTVWAPNAQRVSAIGDWNGWIRDAHLANLRLLYGFMWGHPGKKLLFMGCEFGQRGEWAHEGSLEWHLLQYPEHEGVRRWVADLNRLYRAEPALHQLDFDQSGFEWVDCNDSEQSVLTFLRRPRSGAALLVVCNFTPVPRTNYIVGVPEGGYWREIVNSDATLYGGSGIGNFGGVDSAPVSVHGRFHSLALTLPPLSILIFKSEVADD